MSANSILDVMRLSVAQTEFDPSRGQAPPLLLSDVNLSVKSGEILGVIGGSGAGKSTLGRALLGHARPGTRIIQGQIKFQGKDVLQLSGEALRRVRGGQIAYIAQNPATTFNPSLTLARQIEEVVRAHQGLSARSAHEYAMQLLASLQLPDPEHFGARYAHQVSGGQLQRAMIAMALAGNPSLIVFDEPTTALDAGTRAAVVEMIGSLIREYGKTAIYISHDLDVVQRMADRIVRLEAGKLVSQDEVDAMMQRRSNPPAKSQPGVLLGTAPSKARTVLRLRNISASFHASRPVLRDVSFALAAGNILGIVGKSGGGKSTLGRVICGLHRDFEGSVELRGVSLPKSVRDRSAEQAQQVQMVYQASETAMNPKHTVEKILGRVVRRFHSGSAQDIAQRVKSLLEMVGMDVTFLKRTTREMSGGQIQRIGIARALAAKPDVIVFDEVTSALDVEVAEDILDLLLSLQRDKALTYIFISHDLSAIARICDEVAVVSSGQVVEVGPTHTVLNTPCHADTRALFESATALT